MLTTGAATWDSGLDVMVEGAASRVTDTERLGRLADAWRRKWDGQWQFTVSDQGGFDDGHGVSYVYAVAPHKVLAFGKSPFTHTRHVFGAPTTP